MAAIAATVLENAVMMATDKMEAFEQRRPDLGVVEAFDKYKDELIDTGEVARLRESARRPLDIVVINKHAATIRNTRSVIITPDVTTSAKMGLNWQTLGFDVGITEAINADNHISAARDLSNQIMQGMKGVLKSLDANFAGFLETGKYSSLPSSSLMGISGGAYQTTTDDIFFKAPAVMRNLELEGPYHTLSNVEAMANRTRISTYGTYNQQNLEKLMNGYEWGYSKNLSPGSGQEVYYMIPTGSLAMVDWIEYDCRKGIGSYDQNLRYDTQTLEFKSLSGRSFSMEFGYLYKAEPTDRSSVLAGLERAYVEKWSFFVDIAPVKAYSSIAGESPIVKMVAEAV